MGALSSSPRPVRFRAGLRLLTRRDSRPFRHTLVRHVDSDVYRLGVRLATLDGDIAELLVFIWGRCLWPTDWSLPESASTALFSGGVLPGMSGIEGFEAAAAELEALGLARRVTTCGWVGFVVDTAAVVAWLEGRPGGDR